MLGGVPHAWAVGPGGLQLSPLENSEAQVTPKRRPTAGDVLAGRASLCFERIEDTFETPNTEPRPGHRAREAVRELRPSVSDPGNRVHDEGRDKPKEMGWLEQGRAEIEELLRRPPPEAPHVPEPPRSVTPVRPRIVYPFSPGGTEIKPPPPQRSPKRRTSPSPPRTPYVAPPFQEPAVSQFSPEMKQLAAMLGEAIKGSRVGENRIEDVKTSCRSLRSRMESESLDR